MKKILQAVDGASSKKPAEGSNDMKKFMQIVEGKGPLNRLTAAESIAVNHYTEQKKTITSPVLNVEKDAQPSMIGKYFKTVEQEFAESAQRSKERSGLLASVVAKKILEQEITRRVTPNPDGTVSGGFKPTPTDSNAPPRPSAPSAPAGPKGTNLKYTVLKQMQAGTYRGFAPKLSPEEIAVAIKWKEENGETNENFNLREQPDLTASNLAVIKSLINPQAQANFAKRGNAGGTKQHMMQGVKDFDIWEDPLSIIQYALNAGNTPEEVLAALPKGTDLTKAPKLGTMSQANLDMLKK